MILLKYLTVGQSHGNTCKSNVFRVREYSRKLNFLGGDMMVLKMKNVRSTIRKHMNDGWVPVDEQLPKEYGKYWATIRYHDGRISEPIVADFRGVKQKYVVDTPNGREYETWGIDSAFHGSRVIAWRPYYIPEPYRPERSDNNDGE